MNHRRYGKIKIKNYIPSLLIYILVLALIIAAFIMQFYIEGLLFMVAVVLSFLNILLPYLEQFSISDNIMVTKKLFFSSRMIIPPEAIVIITQADVHLAFGHQSVLLKDRFAISILTNTTLDSALKLLHGKYPSQIMYTNSSIEREAKEHSFIYSFVLTQELLKHVLQITNSSVIIPLSIKCMIDFDNLTEHERVYIDSEW